MYIVRLQQTKSNEHRTIWIDSRAVWERETSMGNASGDKSLNMFTYLKLAGIHMQTKIPQTQYNASVCYIIFLYIYDPPNGWRKCMELFRYFVCVYVCGFCM